MGNRAGDVLLVYGNQKERVSKNLFNFKQQKGK